jgi:phosphoribosylaminoimidazole carboxylase (NCAIR synthetase)
MNKTIGIFGGGQLGRMMAQAALPLNIQCTFFDSSTHCPSAAWASKRAKRIGRWRGEKQADFCQKLSGGNGGKTGRQRAVFGE